MKKLTIKKIEKYIKDNLINVIDNAQETCNNNLNITFDTALLTNMFYSTVTINSYVFGVRAFFYDNLISINMSDMVQRIDDNNAALVSDIVTDFVNIINHSEELFN